MTTTNSYKVIGTRPIRHDGVEKVTGRAASRARRRSRGNTVYWETTIDHDHLFKELVKAFVTEVMALFLPWLAQRLKKPPEWHTAVLG